MRRKTIDLTDELYGYLIESSLREAPILARLREETAAMADAGMQIGPDQGQFMALLVELIGAKRILEVGTFTGYSALAMASALPEDGRLIACDVSEDYTAVAARYWAEAGLADKIELRLGPALETLEGLIAEPAEPFDIGFIDADKENYEGYFERLMTLVRPGGLIAVDNVLWGGSVIDPEKRDAETEAIRAFNAARKTDGRISLSLVPIGDGLTLARKRP